MVVNSSRFSSPAVSICIPTFNGAAYIRECIESALAQTFSNIEVIIADDASTDDTIAIATQLASVDSRVRVYCNPTNLGLVRNWNRAIGLATGKWVKLLFQDDLLDPQYVEELLAIAGGRDIAVVGCFRRFLFEPGTARETQHFYLRNKTLIEEIWGDNFFPAEDVAKFALSNVGINLFGEPTVSLIHRDVFGAVGYFDPTLAQRCDTEFWVRAGINFGLLMVRKELATFRVHKRSTSSQNYVGHQFPDKYLDPIIILRHYLFNDMYEPLRRVLSEIHLAKRLEREFWDRCHRARSKVFSAEGSEGTVVQELWTYASKLYPEIDSIPLSRRVSHSLRNFLWLLRTRVTWE